MEYSIDISVVNIFNYIFYERFEGKKINIQFPHLF